MDLFNIFLDYFDVLKNIAIDLFDQWDKVEIVATRFIHLVELLSLDILARIN